MGDMSIDERLERLAERHEALTQAVELMQHENETRFREIDGQFRKIAATFETALDSIKRLERIAVSHEIRLEDLEGRQS